MIPCSSVCLIMMSVVIMSLAFGKNDSLPLLDFINWPPAAGVGLAWGWESHESVNQGTDSGASQNFLTSICCGDDLCFRPFQIPLACFLKAFNLLLLRASACANAIPYATGTTWLAVTTSPVSFRIRWHRYSPLNGLNPEHSSLLFLLKETLAW